MDANGLKFSLLADEHHWHFPGSPPALDYDSERRSLRLARQQREQRLTEIQSEATARLEITPQARDSYGSRAWFDSVENKIFAVGLDNTPQEIFSFSAPVNVSDIALGEDGVLYIVYDGMVAMHDRRGRWNDELVSLEGFVAWRISTSPAGGAWVLDRTNRQIARLLGYPLSSRASRPYSADVVRPCNENKNPPRLQRQEDIPWGDEETPVALCCSAAGELLCLSWVNGQDAIVRLISEERDSAASMQLADSQYPFSLAWVSGSRFAVLVCGERMEDAVLTEKSEARVYRYDKQYLRQFPAGDYYPLKPDYAFGPFLHGLDYPPHYPSFQASHALHKLSFPFYTRQGEAFNKQQTAPLDSGEKGAVWHRLYIEASIPKGCGVRIWLAANDDVVDHTSDTSLNWYEHRFGERFQNAAVGDVPIGCWSPHRSELAYHPGLLPCQPEQNRKGLFSVLIQRSGLKVRSLRGRYLYLRVELSGTGNTTPEVFAIRSYSKRFSYVEHYLPKLYWENTFAPEADQPGSSSNADFLERFIDNMEGILTSVEDRIAYSDLVTRPQTTPPESLDWLASWVGFQFEAGWNESQRRRFLKYSSQLYQWNGTLRGLNLMLDIATDGAVGGGEIVVLEDYRLRRTFATILGANLDDENDPLTLGGIETGNSFVGDTLFLGDEQRREFLAMYSADLRVAKEEADAIDAFFDRLAFRVSILVHESIESQDHGMIQRVAERMVPAHVEFRIIATSAPLLVGITSLVGVDTYLARHPAAKPARVDVSGIGRGDYVMGPAALDPRFIGDTEKAPELPSAKPVARAADVNATYGESFILDGSDSTAAEGRVLTDYLWSYVD